MSIRDFGQELLRSGDEGVAGQEDDPRVEAGPLIADAPIEIDVVKFVDWYLNRLKDGIFEAAVSS